MDFLNGSVRLKLPGTVYSFGNRNTVHIYKSTVLKNYKYGIGAGIFLFLKLTLLSLGKHFKMQNLWPLESGPFYVKGNGGPT